MDEEYEPISSDTVKAVQLSSSTLRWAASWCKGTKLEREVGLSVPTLQGPKPAYFTDYIVRKRSGDFIVMTRQAFDTKYRKREVVK
jgi:hypothetical protein